MQEINKDLKVRKKNQEKVLDLVISLIAKISFGKI